MGREEEEKGKKKKKKAKKKEMGSLVFGRVSRTGWQIALFALAGIVLSVGESVD